MQTTELTLRRLSAYPYLVPLLLRLGVGLIFFFAGLGKLMGGIDNVTGFFGNIGIPLPGLMAPFITFLELLGGLALILGVLTRIFGILFICNMLVAIIAAKWPAAVQAGGLVAGFNEFRLELLLIMASASLVILGAGALSVDAAWLGDRSRWSMLSRADNAALDSNKAA